MANFVQGNAKSSKFLNRGILWLEIKVNKNAKRGQQQFEQFGICDCGYGIQSNIQN